MSIKVKELTEKQAQGTERYHRLQAWMEQSLTFIAQDECWHDATQIRGPTFDAAVDALPEPEEK